MRKVIAVIPARYESSRFPGKPLVKIKGKPMIQWVYEAASKIQEIDEVYIATDDKKIVDCIDKFRGKYVLTSTEHKSGSDRIEECISKINIDNNDIIINIQGDEPLIQKEMLKKLISAFDDENVYMATLKKEINNDDEINNPNIVKVITDKNDYAIYFSRSIIPYNREYFKDIKYYKHIGVYGYKRYFLKEFTQLLESGLEVSEKLEQLRVIENGYRIKVLETKYESIGVDTPEDICLVEKEMDK